MATDARIATIATVMTSSISVNPESAADKRRFIRAADKHWLLWTCGLGFHAAKGHHVGPLRARTRLWRRRGRHGRLGGGGRQGHEQRSPRRERNRGAGR